MYRHCSQIDVFQQRSHLLLGLNGFGAESYSRGTAFDGVEGEGVGLGRVLLGDVLTDVPHVAVGLLAARIRSLAWVGVQILNAFQILCSVVGLHFETFNGSPHQLLLIIRTFEVLVNHFFPFFGRNWREFAEQFVVFHCVISVLYILLKLQRYKIILYCAQVGQKKG